MSETEPGAHTIKTHGAKVAKKHKHDWLILLLLVVIDIVLNVIHPFYRFVGKDMMTDLKYPLKDNTEPVWAVTSKFFFLCVCTVHTCILSTGFFPLLIFESPLLPGCVLFKYILFSNRRSEKKKKRTKKFYFTLDLYGIYVRTCIPIWVGCEKETTSFVSCHCLFVE